MKRSYKFMIVFLLTAVVFSAFLVFVSITGLNAVRNNTNEAVAQLVSAIKEKYPQISEREIAEILNSQSDFSNTKEQLKQYGIDLDADWAAYENTNVSRNMVVISTLVFIVACLSFLAIFAIFCQKMAKETRQITNYVAQINKKNYDLAIAENSEDEMSLLKNEIYKTTVMLKEQSENSIKDKENLKDTLSDISHQLKTPITSIMVMLDNIIEDENMPAQIRTEFLNDIKRSTNSMSFLVQSILTLSKLDANSIVFKNKKENISQIIDECIRNTAVLAELRDVEVSSECKGKIEIDCDFKWLCEAITNIINNCIEHTGEGGYVQIIAEQNKLYTKISIRDNGCGIEQKDLPHIFERFYKGKNSDENSVGIGLALSKAIVEKAGGLISVDSIVGRGTVFEIKFFNIKFNI